MIHSARATVNLVKQIWCTNISIGGDSTVLLKISNESMAPSTLGHISDPDFNSLNLPELQENEWQRLARAGMPLILPWHHKAISLGTGYHSRSQLGPKPWATETPFNLADLLMQAKIFRPEQGTTSSFTSRETSRKEESNDHTELGFGVGIKPAIPVIEVNVKGSYDKQLYENKDVSITLDSCRD
jgi:hypothetical protein